MPTPCPGSPVQIPAAQELGTDASMKAAMDVVSELVPPAEGSCVWPVSKDVLLSTGVNATDVSVVDLGSDRLRSLVSAYAMRNAAGGVPTFQVVDSSNAEDSDDEEDCGCPCDGGKSNLGGARKAKLKHTSIGLGIGMQSFEHNGETLWVVKQRQGAPVGTNCGAQIHCSMQLVARGRGRERMLHELCDALVEKAEEHVENTYHIFQWNVDHGYWRHRGVRAARPVDSVVLPKETKDRIVGDIDEFLSKETKRFYLQHGIPYKRAYLLWGVPGTGKTSLIQALAGKWRRHICFLQPTDPKFTDDMLKQAITSAPGRSMIIFEDIDALFTKNRENRGKSAVTFSGLLNALDGVGMTEGQVFCLTTNFREQLDAALIRNGRVDVHVEFKHLADEQSAELFRRFFPEDTDLADEFVAELHKVLGSAADTLTPAVLQHFFIKERKNKGSEVISHITKILDEVKRRDSENKEKEETDKKKDAEDDDDDGAKSKKRRQAEAAAQAAASKPTHHWHCSLSASAALTVVGSICIPFLIRARSNPQ